MNPDTKFLAALIETLRTAEKSGTNTQDMLNATLTFAAAVVFSAEPEDRPKCSTRSSRASHAMTDGTPAA